MDVRIRDKLCKMVIHVWIDMNTERIEVEKFKYNIVIDWINYSKISDLGLIEKVSIRLCLVLFFKKRKER